MADASRFIYCQLVKVEYIQLKTKVCIDTVLITNTFAVKTKMNKNYVQSVI